jgi:hypothetical protein
MATARRLLVDPTRSGVFHCVSRCVRRAYLCGWDVPTGRDFEHRRGWIRERMRELAAVFGVEVYSYADPEHSLELLDWTGRQLRAGKRGSIPPHLSPVLDRLDLQVEAWVENVQRYGSLFQRLVGKLDRLRELAHSLGRSWFQGHAGACRLYTHSQAT